MGDSQKREKQRHKARYAPRGSKTANVIRLQVNKGQARVSAKTQTKISVAKKNKRQRDLFIFL